MAWSASTTGFNPVWVVIHCVKKSCRDFKLLTVMSEPCPALRTVCSSIYYNSFFLLSLSVSLSVIMTSLRVPTHLEWNVILVLLILWNVEEGLGPGPLYQGGVVKVQSGVLDLGWEGPEVCVCVRWWCFKAMQQHCAPVHTAKILKWTTSLYVMRIITMTCYCSAPCNQFLY